MKNRIFGLFFSVLTMTFFATVSQSYAYSLEEATTLYNLGIDYYSQNQVQKSMDCFKKAVTIDPKFYEAYYNLAQIQASYGYLDAAIKSYEKIAQIKPDDYESLYELGKLLYKRGYLSRAVATLGKIPSDDNVSKEAIALTQKIKRRQSELALEANQKEDAKLVLQSKMTIQKTPAQQVQSVAQTQNTAVIKPAVIENSNIIAQLQAPSGITTDSQGNIYAASFSENKVYRISALGEKSVYVDSLQLGGPIGLAIDENNYLYVANYTKNNIIKVTPSGVISEFAQLRKPYCINIDQATKSLVVTEQETNNVLKYAL